MTLFVPCFASFLMIARERGSGEARASGLAKGAAVRVDQRRPELVLQVGATRFAVERSIARRVIVHLRRE